MTAGLTTAWPTKYFLSTDEMKWQWVRLGELCEVLGRIPNSPKLTPDQLVSNFAHLARATDGTVPYFWYARENLPDYTEVEKPQRQRPEDAIQFVARYSPYYEQALVPDGWAQDVAKAIRKGAMEIVNFRDTLYLKNFFGKLEPLA